MIIRPCVQTDIPAIAEIYAHYVRHSLISFEVEAPLPEEMSRRRSEIESRALPYLVAECGGSPLGYAYAAPYRARPAYRFTVENSIYVHPSHLRKGIGSKLLSALIDACETAGCRQMVAIIADTGNAASVQLHERLGFRHAGVLQAVGFKGGQWIDTVLMQRAIGTPAGTSCESR